MAPATVHHLPRHGKIVYYAHLGDQEGTAELLPSGTAYLFRLDGARSGRVVSASDPALVLAGLKALADAQRQADGNLAALVCGYGR